MKVLPPTQLIAPQRLVDFYQTARMTDADGIVMMSAVSAASMIQELLWLRSLMGPTIEALKLTGTARELVDDHGLAAAPVPREPALFSEAM